MVTDAQRRMLYQGMARTVGEKEAEVFMDLVPTDVALRSDIVGLRSEFVELRSEVRGEMSELRGDMSELRGEVRAMDSSLSGEIAAMDGRLSGEIAALGSRLDAQLAKLVVATLGISVALSSVVFAAARLGGG